MTKEEVIERVNKIFIEKFDVSAEDIKPESKLDEDFGLDSLDGVDIIVALEKEFKKKINEIVARNLDTMQKIYDKIAEEMGAV